MLEYSREIIGVFMLLLVPLLGIAAWSAVRRERNRQLEQLPVPPVEPAFMESNFRLSGVFYVSTTFAESPLKRVWAHGLGSRGRAELRLGEEGLAVFREGEKALLLPWTGLMVSTDRATIDRGTENNGLLQLEWSLGASRLLTSFRFNSVDDHNTTLNLIRERINAHSN